MKNTPLQHSNNILSPRITSFSQNQNCFAVAVLIFAFFLTLSNGYAMNIQEIKSSKGISAWFVHEPNVPIIVMNFAFSGGSAQDPDGKEGLHYLLSSLMDEGAGEYSAKQFQELMLDHSIDLSFNTDKDSFEGSIRTLSPNRKIAFELLKLALTKPRFDEDAVARMKAQLVSNLKSERENPDRIASQKWSEIAFPNHVYARPSNGTVETMISLQSQDLKSVIKREFARDNLKVVIVGNLSVDEAKLSLDDVFGNLPEKSKRVSIPKIQINTTPLLTVENRVLPQTTLIFGMQGILRDDKDFIPATVIMHILGGGGLNSRLFKEVREKRGLTYGVYAGLESYEATGIVSGSMSTSNDKAREALDVIRDEFAKMAKDGPDEIELNRAKSYLIGSFPLRLDSSKKIASQLLSFQQQGLPSNYIVERRKLIENVTLEDSKRVAARLLNSPMLVTAAGAPVGLK